MATSFSPRTGGGADAERLRRALGGPRLHPLLIFSLLFTLLFVLHAPLLRLPYFWDEAGYYVPAARDLLLTGSLIPQSTLSNAHPPLVMSWLAAWWKLSGYTPAVTRTAMLLIAAFGLLAVFRLARSISNLPVAVAATAGTALYPVYFAQSSMAHVDMAAAAFSLWGITFLLERRMGWTIAAFCLAVLAKETALVVPIAVAIWHLFWRVRSTARENRFAPPSLPAVQTFLLLFAPSVTLSAWYAYHYLHTGYVFGNPGFFQYNVLGTLHPLRIGLALLKRLWQVTGYMNLFLLTVAAAMAMAFPPQAGVPNGRPRGRIPPNIQAIFAVVIGAHVIFFSIVGGAPLARYMLTALPLVMIVCVSTVWRRMREWPLVIGVVCAGFVLALFVNPPYPFAVEDNLAYRDYVVLHKRAAGLVAAHYAGSRILTAWPATDELKHPYLGYSRISIPVVPIDDFTMPTLLTAAHNPAHYDFALLFSTKYEPAHDVFAAWPLWRRWQKRFFGYHRDLPPEVAAEVLGGRIVFRESRNGQWIALVEMDRAEEASAIWQQRGASGALSEQGRAVASASYQEVRHSGRSRSEAAFRVRGGSGPARQPPAAPY